MNVAHGDDGDDIKWAARGLKRRVETQVLGAVTSLVAAGDEESMRGHAAEIRDHAAALAGPDPTALEVLLASVVATCSFLHCHYQSMAAVSASLGTSAVQAAEFEARADRALRRLLASAKHLELIRRLRRPAPPLLAVQINGGSRNGAPPHVES
jgi:hypothetical protein